MSPIRRQTSEWGRLNPKIDIIAAEIVEDLEAALQQFAGIAEDLKR